MEQQTEEQEGQPRQFSRLTIAETLYHQSNSDDNPSSVVAQHCQFLETDEQLWQRRQKIGKEPTNLDIGWIEDWSCLLIINSSMVPNVPPAIRTPEDTQRIEESTVCLYSVKDKSQQWKILPGDSFRGCPTDIESLYLHCPNGSTTVKIVVVPK